jgi:hypothetical protein
MRAVFAFKAPADVELPRDRFSSSVMDGVLVGCYSVSI